MDLRLTVRSNLHADKWRLDAGRLVISFIILVAASLAATTSLARAQAPGARATTTPNPGTVGQSSAPLAPSTPAGAAARVGTGIIRGRVLTVEGTALRRAQVTLRVAGSPPVDLPVVSTDEQGRYEMTEVPAGRHTLSAAKTGYLTLTYGQRRPLETPRPLEIADGQTLDRIDFLLPRGSVIVAHIMDDVGEPLGGVFVQAEYYGFTGGQRRLSSAGSVQTNDLGEARLTGIPPGDYFISADANFGGTSAVIGVSDSGRRYTLTYSPGVLLVSEAQRVTVGVGQEASVSFPLIAARSARVSGVVRNSQGAAPGRGSLGVTRTITNGSTGSGIPLQPDGSFSVSNLLPGEYSLTVSPAAGQAGAPDLSREYARVPISVAGVDQTGLVITTARAANFRGQIVFDTGVAPADVRPTALQPFASFLQNAFLSGGRFSINDDWTFDAVDVAGTGMLRLRAPVNGWSLKAVMLDGKDVTDTAIEFLGNREFKDLQLVLTQKHTEVTGGVVDSRGAVATEYVTVVFGDERSQWTAESRFIATGRPDQQGQFKVTGLPPGRYLAAAVDYLPTGQERDPELLDRLQAAATRITLAEGESRTLGLKLTTY